MSQNISYTFNVEEWEKRPRKTFKINKTWTKSQPAVVSTAENFDDGKISQNISYTFDVEEWEKTSRQTFKINRTRMKSQPAVISTAETFENFDDGRISPAASPVHLRTPSPSKDPIASGSHQQQKSVARGSSGNRAPGSRELRGILENMPSLRNSPLPARRHIVSSYSSQSTSSHSRTMELKGKESGKKTSTVEKQQKKPSSDTVDDKITGKKRKLVISSSSNKPATKRVKKSTSSHENEPVPGQMAGLWVCSKHVQRKKSDLSDIDIVMSSLRDIGEEMFEQSDDEVEKNALHQVVKKSLESLWKMIKHSTVNKNTEQELKQATKELDMRRMELVAKGKERNKELLELSELKYKAHEILQYQQAGSSKEVLAKFNSLKQQNLPTISE